jgi:DNA invertase Pin-like site-specific DNA recombinase
MKLSLKVRRSARVHDPGKFLPGDYELIDCSLMLRARKTAHDGAEQMEKSPRFFPPVASAAIEPVPMTPALFTMRTTPPASAAAKPISLRLRKVRCVFLPASQNADRLVNTCKQSAKGGTASEAVHASTHALTSKGRDCSQYRIYCDKGISGATEKRPALNELFEDCRRGRIDVVVVWKFDRFARSLKHLLNALELFRRLNIDFISCTEAIDTSLPHGEMLFQIIGAIAQWERSLIAERVRAGLLYAKSQGQRLGRPPRRVLTREEIAKLRKERAVSKTPFRILAQKWGVTVFTAHTICGGKACHEKAPGNL